MDTGQLAMLFTPLAVSGQLAGPQSASVLDQPQPDIFADLFAAMVADSSAASPHVGDDMVPSGGEVGTPVQFPVGATMVTALPSGMAGLSFHAVTSGDRPGKSIDDKADTADTTDMASTSLAVAMMVQPSMVLPVVSRQGEEVTEQNAPTHVLDAISSVATSTEVAVANPYPQGTALVPETGDAATTVREAVQGTTLVDTPPVRQPNPVLQEVGKEAPPRESAANPVVSLPDDGRERAHGAGKTGVSVEQPTRPTMEVGQAVVRVASTVADAVSSTTREDMTRTETVQQPGQSAVYVRQEVSSSDKPSASPPANTEAPSQSVLPEVVVSDRFGLKSIQQPDADRGRAVGGAEAVRSADAGTPVRDTDTVQGTIPAGVVVADSQRGQISKPEWVQGTSALPVPKEAGLAETGDVKPGTTAGDKRPVVEAVTVVSGKNDPQQPVEQPEQGDQVRDAVESRPVRSAVVGTVTIGHQPVAPTSQEPVAKGTEAGVRMGQVAASGVAAQVDSFNPGTSGDEAGDLGRRAAQETPQVPQTNVSTVHQQTAFSGAEALTQAAGVANLPEQLKAEQGHIVNQVKEQLAAHEVKQGSDQITLRLSPQNLGDIQVNLRLDNQQLKVEIVAQNHTVRDALMQNTDSLKESLARQNISMESFDVTTGGNGGFQQGSSTDWKQLAQQRQANPWMPSGYHTGGKEEVLRNMPVYLARQEHAMVDLHF